MVTQIRNNELPQNCNSQSWYLGVEGGDGGGRCQLNLVEFTIAGIKIGS
jgi:hypothetical protein